MCGLDRWHDSGIVLCFRDLSYREERRSRTKETISKEQMLIQADEAWLLARETMLSIQRHDEDDQEMTWGIGPRGSKEMEETDSDDSPPMFHFATTSPMVPEFQGDEFEDLLTTARILRKELPEAELKKFMRKPTSSIRKCLRAENGHVPWRQQMRLREELGKTKDSSEEDGLVCEENKSALRLREHLDRCGANHSKAGSYDSDDVEAP